MTKAVFLDRDGVINRKAPEGEYIISREQLVILPGVTEAVRSLNRAGYWVVVATNQRGVSTGKIRVSELHRIHEELTSKLAQGGAMIHRIYYCPHDIDTRCGCRKPEPGMLERAVEDLGIDTRASWMVGDSPADIQAGERAGCRTILINEEPSKIVHGRVPPQVVTRSLHQAVQIILNFDRPSPTQEPSASCVKL